MKANYIRIVELVRDVFPTLALDNVMMNLSYAIKQVGISIKYSDMHHLENGQDIDGYVYINKDSIPEIVLNHRLSDDKERFTIAHELGHILLHWKWLPNKEMTRYIAEISYRTRAKYYNKNALKRELEADRFAIELLSPIKEVQQLIKKCEKNHVFEPEQQIKEIEITYKIPNKFAYYRWLDATKELD